MAAINSDTMLIHSLVMQAVNEKLEAAVICGVANAIVDNVDHSPTVVNTGPAGDGSNYSTIQSASKSRTTQSGNVGDFLSNKNYK